MGGGEKLGMALRERWGKGHLGWVLRGRDGGWGWKLFIREEA